MAAPPYPAYQNGAYSDIDATFICNMTAMVLTPAEIGEPKRE
ncbi:hypothetical protein [Kosakonia cowanii]|nr:hypothetical protein [Kosakonia cowanii]